MVQYLGYLFIGAGLLTFLIASFDRSRKSRPLIFAAAMMVLAGLAILQYLGTEVPDY